MDTADAAAFGDGTGIATRRKIAKSAWFSAGQPPEGHEKPGRESFPAGWIVNGVTEAVVGDGLAAADRIRLNQIAGLGLTAESPRSPVRMRTASSTGMTKILPSPILPVLAVFMIVETT